jgi:hypothetical protein
MPAARIAALLAFALVSLLAVPAAALAVEPVTVSGTVVRGGAPVNAAQVVVHVTGSDQLAATTTDEQGAFSVTVDAEVGSEVRIDVTGQTSRSGPDAQGCVTVETPSGALTFTIDAVPLEPLEVPMDDVVSGKVCGPTPTPRVTPPSTDVLPPLSGSDAGVGLVVVLGLVSLLAGVGLALTARRWR